MLEHRVEDQSVVEPRLHAVACHLQGDVVPASRLHMAPSAGGLQLASVADLLDGMLGVAPSTEVQPAVVLLVHIVEDDEEALVAFVLSGAELTSVVVAVDDVLFQTDGGLLVARLTDGVAFLFPVTIDVFQVVLIRLERGSCSPCAETSVTLLGCQLFVVRSLVGVVLGNLHHLRSDVLWHELLDVIGGSAHDAAAAEAYHVGAPTGVVLVDENGRIGCQFHHVAVVFHAHHIDGLAQGCVHVA